MHKFSRFWAFDSVWAKIAAMSYFVLAVSVIVHLTFGTSDWWLAHTFYRYPYWPLSKGSFILKNYFYRTWPHFFGLDYPFNFTLANAIDLLDVTCLGALWYYYLVELIHYFAANRNIKSKDTTTKQQA